MGVIINFATQLKHETLEHGRNIKTNAFIRLYFEVFVFFLTFFVVWYELSVTITRFTNQHLVDQIVKFIFLCGIIAMTLQLQGVS